MRTESPQPVAAAVEPPASIVPVTTLPTGAPSASSGDREVVPPIHLRPPINLPPLIPPFRYCVVEEGVLRGAYPTLKNMRYMRRLNLRTMISLVPDTTGPTDDLKEYCVSERIRHLCHFVEKYDDRFSHTPHLVASIVSELIEPQNHPVFLHCRDGGHNTGIVIMCLRRLQNWSLPAIYHEFVRYTKSNSISYEEKQFVESFHETVTVPIHIPWWLWGGIRHRRHPSIQLRLDRDMGTPVLAQSPSNSIARDLDQIASASVLRLSGNDQTLNKTRYKKVELRYNTKLAALDLHGVHLTKR